jgi:hypothetical protein
MKLTKNVLSINYALTYICKLLPGQAVIIVIAIWGFLAMELQLIRFSSLWVENFDQQFPILPSCTP